MDHSYQNNKDDLISKTKGMLSRNNSKGKIEIVPSLDNNAVINNDSHHKSINIDDEIEIDPFTWIMPIEILCVSYSNNLTSEINYCLDPVIQLIQKY